VPVNLEYHLYYVSDGCTSPDRVNGNMCYNIHVLILERVHIIRVPKFQRSATPTHTL